MLQLEFWKAARSEMDGQAAERTTLQEQLTSKNAKRLQLVSKKSGIKDEQSRVKLQHAGDAAVSYDLNSLAGVREILLNLAVAQRS